MKASNRCFIVTFGSGSKTDGPLLVGWCGLAASKASLDQQDASAIRGTGSRFEPLA
jgi:hypothetical protein